jgi:O-methyltransferase involved in polyketide biosynthesis
LEIVISNQEPAVPEFDVSTPNVARMYDYYLGGKDNFAADREAAERALSVAPELRVGALENRRFLHRVIRFLVGAGVRQFVDLGCGLPTQGNVHEVAQSLAPDTRVVYVDNDPVVIAHGRGLRPRDGQVTVIQADVREPGPLLADPAFTAMIDTSQPVAFLLIALLHVIPDDDVAATIVRRVRETMSPGSYLAIAHAVSDLRPDVTARLATLYQDSKAITGPRRANLRTHADIVPYFDGLELVEPGLVYLPQWRPDAGAAEVEPGAVWALGGVARKP